jgi:hypothetical protein
MYGGRPNLIIRPIIISDLLKRSKDLLNKLVLEGLIKGMRR